MTAVNETAFRWKSRAGQVTRTPAASRLAAWYCLFFGSTIWQVYCLQLVGLLRECEVWAAWF